MARTGWECPKCGRVYSPKVLECAECNKAPVASKPYYPYWPYWPYTPYRITPTPWWEYRPVTISSSSGTTISTNFDGPMTFTNPTTLEAE